MSRRLLSQYTTGDRDHLQGVAFGPHVDIAIPVGRSAPQTCIDSQHTGNILHGIGIRARIRADVAVESVAVEDKDSALFSNLDQEVRMGSRLIGKNQYTP